ncbi:hypothetical protein E8E14_007389 [Neopestalotiopsis sp. 37M]|nr:hypothetical protein E8E14_007389 [Neopestalotiopsis sp. 37M]
MDDMVSRMVSPGGAKLTTDAVTEATGWYLNLAKIAGAGFQYSQHSNPPSSSS